ncbi:hypothetical protein [Mesobacillus boroniphilus]|uniref:hypothetical protein n=1 Tax=Mesobacillus boroniphilus TaxID=308892 RepID=UPI000A67F4BE|nr:hypothetical protein [Mesobacillus boroniphilus]
MAWFVLDTTNSAFITSSIYAITFIINVFLGPFVGVLVDRTNPKKAMQRAYLVMGIIGVFLAFSYIFWSEYIIITVLAMVVVNDLAQALFILPGVGCFLVL